MRKDKKTLDIDLSRFDIKPMPHSDNTEQCVLGSIQVIPDLYNLAQRFLNQPDMFYMPLNSKVWEVMRELSESKVTPDRLNVLRVFQGRNDKEMVAYAASLLASADSDIHFPAHCLKLNEYWIQRNIYKVGFNLNRNAISRNIDALDLLGDASSELDKIYRQIAGIKESTLNEAVNELSEQIVKIHNSPDKILGLRSSLDGINGVIKGYRKGNLIIVGASTSEGKSTLAFQEILYLAELGIPVGVCLLEMTTADFLLMLACNKMGISTELVMDGQLNAQQMDHLSKTMAYLRKLPIKISDKPGLRAGEIKALGRMWKKHLDIQMMFIDHLHLANDDKDHTNAEQKFTSIANKFKELAKELDIPVMALAQLARKEVTEVRVHRVTDLKYAGGIEQAADVIMLIYRPEHHGIDKTPDGGSTKGFARVIIGKLRLLPKRDVKCHFTGLQFKDWQEFVNVPTNQAIPDNPRAGISPNRNYQNSSTPWEGGEV